ncbi:very short patch repair endonuclease [Candidatus Margulisiibacteriota bacterium]
MPRSPEVTYKIMSAIKSKNTKPEVILGKHLWKLGLRYRKNYKIKGKPDFVFIKAKIAVFCDGDFWHGNNWRIRGMKSFKEELASYSEFWRNKILTNVNRDRLVTEDLINKGWLVIRIWESDIKKDPEECAQAVKKAYIRRSS